MEGTESLFDRIDLSAFAFVAVVLGALVMTACGGREPETLPGIHVTVHATRPSRPVVTPIETAAADAPTPATPVVRVVEFRHTTTLYKQPKTSADPVGVIGRGARAAVVETATAGSGCAGEWIRIAPRGWTCETAIADTDKSPTRARPSDLDPSDDDDLPLVPGVYGVVRGAEVSTSIRVVGTKRIDGVRYVRTSAGELFAASTVARFRPSHFHGIALEPGRPMPAWVRNRHNPYKPVRAYTTPHGKRAGELAPRTVVSILETSKDGRFVRIDDARWLARRDLRVPTVTDPPPGTGDDEKWFDVDRDEQVLVAYEGTRPVFATLVSTGKWKHETPTLIARVAKKLRTSTMTSNGDSKYSVADVPWTMYYDRDYALHTSYWHDGFGSVRSHGCINLAPRDARVLYGWSSPDVPPGWIAVYGDADNPGSLVRVRSRQVPEPRFRGYARQMRRAESMVASN